MQKMFRQGDVLVELVEALPKDKANVVPREERGLVLAHGETTGHAHVIHDHGAILMSFDLKASNGRPATTERYLRLERQTMLSHEEPGGQKADHEPIDLPAGTYKVTIQRQWEPDERGWSAVMD